MPLLSYFYQKKCNNKSRNTLMSPLSLLDPSALLFAGLAFLGGLIFKPAPSSTAHSSTVNVNQYNNSTAAQEKTIQPDKQSLLETELFTYAKYAATIAIAGFYIKTFYTIKKTQNVITSGKGVSGWKSNISLDNLLKMDEKQLLMDFEQEVTVIFADDTDFIFDKKAFIALKVQDECYMLKHYLETYQKIERLHLTAIFPLDQKCCTLAKERLHKLTFIKKFMQ